MAAPDLLPGGPARGAGCSRQIKEWAREAWLLPPSATVIVTELQCSEPGCPPRETVIAVFDAGGASRQSRLHKSMTELTARDIEDAAPPGC